MFAVCVYRAVGDGGAAGVAVAAPGFAIVR